MSDDVDQVAEERARRQEDEARVTCPRCRTLIELHLTRCQACGLWFMGEAFEFAAPEGESEVRARARRVIRRLVLAFAVVAILLVLVVLLKALVR